MADDVVSGSEGAINRGLKADALLRDPVMVRAFAGIRDGLVSQLERIPVTDKELAHEVVISLQLLAQLHKQLDRFIRDGKFEQNKKLQESGADVNRRGLRALWPRSQG